MTKLVQALIARIITAQTDAEWNQICGDVDTLYQQERIKWQEHELLYRMINRLHT